MESVDYAGKGLRSVVECLGEEGRLFQIEEADLPEPDIGAAARTANKGIGETPPATYDEPQTINDLVNHTVGRVLDLFDLDDECVKSRGGHG